MYLQQHCPRLSGIAELIASSSFVKQRGGKVPVLVTVSAPGLGQSLLRNQGA